METGKLKPVIDRGYTLKQIPKDHKYIEKGHVEITVVKNN